MSFMDSYKRLDNLCKGFPEYLKGISSYIEVMERSNQMRHRCMSWSYDYECLRKYRHIRNQIAHDNGVYEEDVCDVDDIDWLEDFRSRMINQTDPLGQYYKAQRASVKRPDDKSEKPPHTGTTRKSARNPIGCGAYIASAIAIAFAIAVVFFAQKM